MKWDWEIGKSQPWFRVGTRELLSYKDLILRFSKRDLLASYQQTLIGPFWLILQPILTTVMYVIIFSNVVKISTNGVPPLLFYLPGIIIWNYFSECLSGAMNTFQYNGHIFGKVYFPRLIVPISQVITSSFRMLIQLLIFVIIYFFYKLHDNQLHMSFGIIWMPVALFLSAGFSFGLGLIISVMTAKYRDLDSVMQFVLRLFMFAVPVIYSSTIVPETLRPLFWLNPLTPAIELVRFGFFGTPIVPLTSCLITCCLVILLCVVGVIVFKRNEIKVMDTL